MRRIIEISYKNKLSHLGSCLTAVDIIDEIYSIKKPDEKFCLSSGHAGLALYCVIEKYFKHSPKSQSVVDKSYECDAERMLAFQGIHPDRKSDLSGYIDCSAGSLGNGLPIAVGMALADRSKNVYCLISDGECAEGSIYEALRIFREQKLSNLHIYLNYNKWGAYRRVSLDDFFWYGDIAIRETNVDDFPFLKGQIGHYQIMDETMYKQAMEVLK